MGLRPRPRPPMTILSTHTPALSVVLPFYNAEATLDETLASIAAQTLVDFELVAIDDGSSDGSAALVRRWMARDGRIRLLQPGHQGVVGAMNSGLAAARAAVVARMDADDRMYPQRLAAQLAYLDAHPGVSLVGCQVRLIPPEQVTAGFAEYIRWQNQVLTPEDVHDEIYVELPIANPTICFRRAAVAAVGGFRDGDFPEDYELQLRLHGAGHALAKLPQVLLDWRESSGRLTRTDPRYAREAFDRIRALWLARDARLHGGRPLVFWGAGRRTRQRSVRLIALGHTPCAYVDIDPRKIGNAIAGVPVVAPQWLDQGQQPRPFVLSYVSNHGARELIAAQLQAMGYARGRDYLMVG